VTGTALNSSPHNRVVSEGVPKTRPKRYRCWPRARPPARWSVFRSGCKRRPADIWSQCCRSVSVLPGDLLSDWQVTRPHSPRSGPYSPDVRRTGQLQCSFKPSTTVRRRKSGSVHIVGTSRLWAVTRAVKTDGVTM